MCAEKTNNTREKSQPSDCMGMEEMMKKFCSENQETSDCCSQLQTICSSSTTGKSGFMTMCENMKSRFFEQSKKPQNEKEY
jgi:hypothetical protein